MSDAHDPLCPMREPEPGDTVRQSSCMCYLIARVRDDQRGFDIRQQIAERSDFRARVAALPTVPSTYDGAPILPDPATIAGVLALLDGVVVP